MSLRKEPQVLEVITAMARIATLSFYPIGTKIGIRGHKTVLCHKDDSYVTQAKQAFDRLLNNDSRNDLYMFNRVIINYIKWYVIPYKNKDKETYTNLMNLIKYTIVGFNKLKSTYETGQLCNAILVIQYFINTLTKVITDEFDLSTFHDCDAFYHNDTFNSEDVTMSSIFDTDKLINFWSKEQINELCEYFNNCFNFDVDDDIETVTMNISQSSSLIDCENELKIILPTPLDENDPTVIGSIVSINATLEKMDKRFSEALTHSVRGDI